MQVAVLLLMYHLMNGEKPLPGQANAGAVIVCHDDFVIQRNDAGRNLQCKIRPNAPAAAGQKAPTSLSGAACGVSAVARGCR
jgi:hypothetical protein